MHSHVANFTGMKLRRRDERLEQNSVTGQFYRILGSFWNGIDIWTIKLMSTPIRPIPINILLVTSGCVFLQFWSCWVPGFRPIGLVKKLLKLFFHILACQLRRWQQDHLSLRPPTVVISSTTYPKSKGGGCREHLKWQLRFHCHRLSESAYPETRACHWNEVVKVTVLMVPIGRQPRDDGDFGATSSH